MKPISVLNWLDSTANGLKGTTIPGSLGGKPTSTTGEIDGGVTQAGEAGESISIGTSTLLNLSRNFTISGWINPSACSGNINSLISNGKSGWLLRCNTVDKVDFLQSFTADIINGSTAITDGTWNYFVATVGSGGTATITVYTNGVADGNTTYSGTFSPNTGETTNIGIDCSGCSQGAALNGSADEVRVTKVALSPSWILTEYNNQKSPSTFYAIGAETAFGGGGGIVQRILNFILNFDW